METYNKISNIGKNKCKQNLGKQFLSSMLSGAFLGFGAACSFRVGGMITNNNLGLKRLMMGLFGLPIGLMLIVLCKTQLFTGNTSFYTISIIEKKIKLSRTFISLLVIYLGNLIGSILFALLVYGSGILENNNEVLLISQKKVSGNWITTFIKGLLCNWFVCLSLWQAVSSDNVIGKAIGIYPTIAGFVALGFEHSVANMYIIPQGIMLGSNVTISDFILFNLIPVTLGNIVSGVLFVGVVSGILYKENTNL